MPPVMEAYGRTGQRWTFSLALPCWLIAIATPVPATAGEWPSIERVQDYFSSWFSRVDAIQAEQPHWMTPVVTVTPRLEEEFRYDQFWQSLPHGRAVNNFGAGKGLELIPWQNIEVILGVPPYLSRNKPRGTDGFGDWSFLLKYRLLAAPEEQGNYILTLFMAASAPLGSKVNGAGHALYTPTIAFGKGWGDFDLQSTLNDVLPSGGLSRLGMPLLYNTTFQYHAFEFLWPELEVNYTWWPNGRFTGKNQVFLTPSLIVGRIRISKRLKFIMGVGYQVAVTHHSLYNHNLILTVRTPF
jgi:hypothetical protein